MTTSTAANCSFCGEPGTSEEHAFANWIAALFEDASPFTLTRTLGRNKVKKKEFGVTTRASCVKCNTGWMRDFEEEARPLLVPIMRGESGLWPLEAQELVSRWALKTALMIDRSRRPPHATLAEHFKYLFDHRLAPASVQIFLGRYLPAAGEEHRAASAGAVKLSAGDLDAYRIVFNAGQAVFQVCGHAGIESIGLEIAHVAWGTREGSPLLVPLTDMFRRLWPSTSGDYEWPPAGSPLNTFSLDRIYDSVPRLFSR